MKSHRLEMPVSFPPLGLKDRDWDTLCDVIFPEAQDPEVIVRAVRYCQSRKLDVFKKVVSIVPMWSTTYKKFIETVYPNINEMKTRAVSTGVFAGNSETEYGPKTTSCLEGKVWNGDKYQTQKIEITHPEWAAVKVYRLVGNVKCEFSSDKIFWLETYAKMGNQESKFPTPAWILRPYMQLAKCAMAAALRLAFPEAGEYCAEEMEGRTFEQASTDHEVITAEILDKVDTIPPLPEDFDARVIPDNVRTFINKAVKKTIQKECYGACAELFQSRLQGEQLAFAIYFLDETARRGVFTPLEMLNSSSTLH